MHIGSSKAPKQTSASCMASNLFPFTHRNGCVTTVLVCSVSASVLRAPFFQNSYPVHHVEWEKERERVIVCVCVCVCACVCLCTVVCRILVLTLDNVCVVRVFLGLRITFVAKCVCGWPHSCSSFYCRLYQDALLFLLSKWSPERLGKLMMHEYHFHTGII